MLFTTNVDAMHVVWHGSLPVHLKSINCNYLCSCDQGGTLPTKITPQEIMDHDAFRNSGDIMMMMMLMAYDRRPYDYDEDDDDDDEDDEDDVVDDDDDDDDHHS